MIISKLCCQMQQGTTNFTHAYFIPFIFAKFSPNITPSCLCAIVMVMKASSKGETEPIISYTFYMFMLNLIVLVCFFNIVGYIISIYLVNK